jgi:tetratricopeptide (TPR) repeat protein
MRIGGRWFVIALLIVVAALGLGGYFVGRQLWAGYHRRQAVDALARRAFDEADTHLSAALEVWPDDVALRLLAAQTARRRGDFSEAWLQLREYESRHGPEEAGALETRLLVLQQGNLQETDVLLAECTARPGAAQTPIVLEAVIDANLKALLPAYSQGLTTGGKLAEPVLLKTRRAIDLWLELRTARPDKVQGLVWRGHTHVFAWEMSEAMADLRQAVELDPDHREARRFLAKFLAENHPAEAAPHLEFLQDRYPNDTEVRLWLAENRRNLGRPDEARDILEELLAKEPTHVAALLERGQVALDLRQPEEAERLLRRALELAPRDPTVNKALGDCLQLAGRHAEAKQFQETCHALHQQMVREWAQRYYSRKSEAPN